MMLQTGRCALAPATGLPLSRAAEGSVGWNSPGPAGIPTG